MRHLSEARNHFPHHHSGIAVKGHCLRILLRSRRTSAHVTMKDDEDDLDTFGLSICALPVTNYEQNSFCSIFQDLQDLHTESCMLLKSFSDISGVLQHDIMLNFR